MLSCNFLKYFVLVLNLFELFRPPILSYIYHFEGVQIFCILFPHCKHLPKSPFSNEFQDFEFLQIYNLFRSTHTLRHFIINATFILVLVLIRLRFTIQYNQGHYPPFSFWRFCPHFPFSLLNIVIINIKLEIVTTIKRFLGFTRGLV